MDKKMEKMNNRAMIIMAVLCVISIAIGLIGTARAEVQTLPPQKQGTCVDIPQTCSNCTFVNITQIKYPNSTVEQISSYMTKYGYNYNYSFCKTDSLGNYIVTTCGNPDAVVTCVDYDFPITYTGTEFISQEYGIYIAAVAFIILLMLGLVFIITRLPGQDAMNEDGAILQINMMKHLRPVLWIAIWGLGLACLFILSNIGIAYLSNAMIGNLFFTLYQVFFWITIIGIPIYFCLIFYKIFKDKETQRLIERRVDIRGTP